MSNRLVCICNLVAEKEIISALKKGAASLDDIQMFTNAGTGCGRCHVIIDRMVTEYLESHIENSQRRIDFDV